MTLNIEAILENVDSLGDGTDTAKGQPVTSKQEVKTQTILRHGESIIIGGLIKNTSKEDKTKLPFLGDIPWIGEWLFGSTSNSMEETNLVVVLTPYIVDNSEKLSLLQQELGILTRMQREYNERVFERIENGEPLESSENLDTNESFVIPNVTQEQE